MVRLTVGAGNQNLEAVSPLTFIGGFISGHWSTPKRTLKVGGARWVGAIIGVWINRWITASYD